MKIKQLLGVLAGILILSFLSFCFLKYFHFFQNESDREFEEILLGVIKPVSLVMFDDIKSGDWSEVCILPPYKKPAFHGDRMRYMDQLYGHDMAFSIPIFLDKFNSNVWWIFFADSKKNIGSIYRMSRRLTPYPIGNEGSKDIIKKIPGVFASYDDGCLPRNSAALIGYPYGNGNFLFVALKK